MGLLEQRYIVVYFEYKLNEINTATTFKSLPAGKENLM